MITIGHWKGKYKYAKEAHQKMLGFPETNFDIHITNVDSNGFVGTVQDDLTTGGTEGIGEIKGTVSDNAIEFVKQMPVMTILTGKEGEKRTFNRKHRKIFYSGIISEDGHSMSGQWKFKPGIFWWGIIPLWVPSIKGSWKMETVNNL